MKPNDPTRNKSNGRHPVHCPIDYRGRRRAVDAIGDLDQTHLPEFGGGVR